MAKIDFVPIDETESLVEEKAKKQPIAFVPLDRPMSRRELANIGVTEQTNAKQRESITKLLARRIEERYGPGLYEAVDTMTRAAPVAQMPEPSPGYLESEPVTYIGRDVQVAKQPSADGKIGFVEGFTQNPLYKVPFIGAAAEGMDLAQVYMAAKRLQDPKYDWKMAARERSGEEIMRDGSPVVITFTPDQAREIDVRMVNDYVEKLAERAERGYTIPGRIGQGLSVLPGWMIEFAMTGGAKQLASKPAKKFLQKAVKSRIAAGLGGWAAGAAARTTIGMPHRVFASTMRRKLEDDTQGWATSIAKGWGETFIEAASEEAGGTITKGLAAPLKRLPFGRKFITALRTGWMKLSPDNTAAKFAKNMLTKAGYSNMIGEYGEEKLATLMHGLVGTEDFGAGKEAGPVERILAGIGQDLQPENFVSEVAVLSVPQLLGLAGGQLGPRGGIAELETPAIGPTIEAAQEGRTVAAEAETTPKAEIEAPVAAEKGAAAPSPTADALTVEKTANQLGIRVFESRGVTLYDSPVFDTAAEAEEWGKKEGVYQTTGGAGGLGHLNIESDRIRGTVEYRWRANVKPKSLRKALAEQPVVEPAQAENGAAEGKTAAKKPALRGRKPQPGQATRQQTETGETFGLSEQQVIKRLQRAEQRYQDLRNKPAEDLTPARKKELEFLTRKRTDIQALLGRDTKPLSRQQVERRAAQFEIPFRGRTSRAVMRDIVARAAEQRAAIEKTGWAEWRKGEPINVTPDKLLKYALQHEARGARIGYLAGQLDLTANHTELLEFAEKALPKGEYKLVVRAARRIVKGRTPAELQKVVKAVNKMVANYEHSSAVAEYKDVAKKILADIKKRKPMQKKGIRPEYAARLQELMETIATTKPTKKTLHQIDSLSDYLGKLREEMDTEYGEQYAEDLIPKTRLSILDKIGKKPLVEMTTEEIRDVTDELKRVLHLNQSKNKTILNMRTADNAELLTNVRKEAANAVPITKAAEVLSSVGQREGALKGTAAAVAGYRNDDVETLVEALSGGEQGELYEVCVEDLREGREIANAFFFDMTEPIREVGPDPAWFDKNVRAIAGKKALTQTVRIAGKPVELTMDEIMDIYMMAQSADDRAALLNSPVAFPDEVIGRMDADELRNIVGLIAAKPRIVCAKAAELIETRQKPALNGVTVELDGIEKFTEPDYWPRRRRVPRSLRGNRDAAVSLFENRGWTKERVGGNKPILIHGFYAKYYGMAKSTGEYVGLAKPMRAIKMLINDAQVTEMLQKKGYDSQRNALITLFERIEQHAGDDSYISRFFAIPLRGATRAVLAEPGIFVGQYTSVGGYFTEVPKKYLSALRVKASKADIAELKQHWKTGKMRIEGMLSSAVLGDIASRDQLRRAVTGKTKVRDKPTSPIHYVDTLAIVDGWRIAKAWVADNLPNLKGEDYWIAVRRKADYLVRRTQPMFDTEGRSVQTSDPRLGLRQFVLFRSYIDQALRMVHRANTKLANKKITKAQWAKQVGIVWSTLAANVMIRSFMRLLTYSVPAIAISALLTGKYKAKEPKEVAYEIGRDTALAPLRTLTYVGWLAYWASKAAADVVGKRLKLTDQNLYKPEGDMGTVAQDLVVNTVGAAGKFAYAAAYSGSGQEFISGPRQGQSKGYAYLWEAIKDTAYTSAMLLGMPAPAIRRFKNELDEQFETARKAQKKQTEYQFE